MSAIIWAGTCPSCERAPAGWIRIAFGSSFDPVCFVDLSKVDLDEIRKTRLPRPPTPDHATHCCAACDAQVRFTPEGNPVLGLPVPMTRVEPLGLERTLEAVAALTREWDEARMREEMALGLEPEEWVARHAWAHDQWPFHRHRYADPLLDTWVRAVSRILATPGLRAAAEARFLTPEEIAAQHEAQGDGW